MGQCTSTESRLSLYNNTQTNNNITANSSNSSQFKKRNSKKKNCNKVKATSSAKRGFTGETGEQENGRKIEKLLLLGSGDSGKSTMFKQIVHLYSTGFSDQDYRGYISTIHDNTVSAIKILVEQALKRKCLVLNGRKLDFTISSHLKESVRYVCCYGQNQPVCPEFAQHVKLLQQDPGIRNIQKLHSALQILDGAKYFFEKIEIIGSPDYLPSYDDILMCRKRTVGIVESRFTIDNCEFTILDVGGQKNERKKQIHCFECVTAVLFVVAISEYDQVLLEDLGTNRMSDALHLFQETCNSRQFKNSSIILLLNKYDIFKEKIQETPISVFFKNYDGKPDDYEQSSSYIRQVFESKASSGRDIYCHLTCATDTKNMSFIVNAVKNIVIRSVLEKGGIIGYM